MEILGISLFPPTLLSSLFSPSMRFRAVLKDAALLQKITQTFLKIEKGMVVKLTPSKTEFIIIANVTDGFQVWSGIDTATLFDEIRLESLTNNEIYFHLSLENLDRALKSCQNVHQVSLRLTKRQNIPYLHFTIELMMTKSMSISHSVPIELLTAKEMATFKEPQLPDPEVYIFMPTLKNLRTVIDRMKNLDDYISIHANMAGEITFKVHTEMVELATFYKGLGHPTLPNRDAGQDASLEAACRIDIKKLSRFLWCHLINPQNVIMCIVKEKALIFHVLLDDLFMTYYVPVILDS